MHWIETFPRNDHYRVTVAMWVCDVCISHYRLSIQIARFHSQSRRGAYGRDKYTCAGTLAKNVRGAYARGGHISGIL